MGGFYDGPIDDYETLPPHPDWRPQVVELAPGQSIDFELPASRVLFGFRGARAARMSVAYDYAAVPARDANGELVSAPDSLGAMAAVPPFGLRSNEIEWLVRSPLEIEILPRADRDPSRSSSLADHLRIVLRNGGDEAVEISSAQAPARLEISASGLIVEQGATEVRGTLVLPPLTIPPHGEISFLDDPTIDANSMRPLVTLAGPKPERACAEVLLHRAGWIDSQRATWVAAAR
jgi:hypothetical protein